MSRWDLISPEKIFWAVSWLNSTTRGSDSLDTKSAMAALLHSTGDQVADHTVPVGNVNDELGADVLELVLEIDGVDLVEGRAGQVGESQDKAGGVPPGAGRSPRCKAGLAMSGTFVSYTALAPFLLALPIEWEFSRTHSKTV